MRLLLYYSTLHVCALGLGMRLLLYYSTLHVCALGLGMRLLLYVLSPTQVQCIKCVAICGGEGKWEGSSCCIVLLKTQVNDSLLGQHIIY